MMTKGSQLYQSYESIVRDMQRWSEGKESQGRQYRVRREHYGFDVIEKFADGEWRVSYSGTRAQFAARFVFAEQNDGLFPPPEWVKWVDDRGW